MRIQLSHVRRRTYGDRAARAKKQRTNKHCSRKRVAAIVTVRLRVFVQFYGNATIGWCGGLGQRWCYSRGLQSASHVTVRPITMQSVAASDDLMHSQTHGLRRTRVAIMQCTTHRNAVELHKIKVLVRLATHFPNTHTSNEIAYRFALFIFSFFIQIYSNSFLSFRSVSSTQSTRSNSHHCGE